MKTILTGVAIIGAVFLGSNAFFDYKVEKQLETGANFIKMMGGNFFYSNVNVSFGGNVEIENVTLLLPGMEDNLRAQKVVLHTGGVLGPLTVANDFDNQRLPNYLGLSLEKMTFPLDVQSYGQASNPNFQLGGCIDNVPFGSKDYREMGINEFATLDSKTEITVNNEGQWLDIKTTSNFHDLYDIGVSIDISLNSASRDLMSLGMASQNASIRELVFDFEDQGYASKVIDYCSAKSEISNQQFIAQHILLWQQNWHNFGLTAGENTTTVYSQFLHNPGKVQITVSPLGGMSFADMRNNGSSWSPSQLRTSVALNGEDMGSLDLRLMSQDEHKAWLSLQASESEPTPIKQAEQTPARRRSNKPTDIDVSELIHQTDRYVLLALKNGKKVKGKILETTEDNVLLHSYHAGGSMKIPIAYNQIRSAKLQ